MSKGYVYVLSNPHMSGLVKIGMTTRDVEKRVYELSQATGVPSPFDIVHQIYSPDCSWVEGSVHAQLEHCRLPNREFFSCSIQEAVDIVDKTHVAVMHEFMNEFSDGVSLTDRFSAIDPTTVISISDELGLDVMQVNEAISMVSADELRPAVARYFALLDSRKFRDNASKIRVVS